MSEKQIATYFPNTGLEATGDVQYEGNVTPTPSQLAQMSRALGLLADVQGPSGVMATVPDELTANLQTFITIKAQEKGRLAPSGSQTLEAKFDERDILGWAGSFFTWWQKFKPFEWKTPDAPLTVPNTFRLALFGDWATGLYGAPVCAESMAKDKDRYHVVLHLGDTYYSGTGDEIADRLVKFWPKVTGALNRSLNGNHEMYTGGRAYYPAIEKFGQMSSYFALQNDHWILAALDTSYADHDLHGDQAAWIQQLASDAPGKKLVLFSHHQPFSLLDSQGPKLVEKLDALFSTKRIYAWYWGHEHHCILYGPHKLYGLRGRCVGHGGFPYFRETKVVDPVPPPRPIWKRLDSRNLVPSARMLDGVNPFIEGHEKEYGPHGYMSLEFEDEDLFEIVHDATGERLWAQPIEKDDPS
jgi:calcineurin-like phosphoesterase family protein